MIVTPLAFAAAMLTPAAIVGTVAFILLRRERARRNELERERSQEQIASGLELRSLQSHVHEANLRASRLAAAMRGLWQVAIKQQLATLAIKGKYKRVSQAFASQGEWRRHYRWKAKELDALVKRIIIRWEKDRRASARESLMQELLGAVLHVFGVPHPGK